MMSKIVEFVLEKIVYKILQSLKKRKYLIPMDTTRDNVKRTNVTVNIVCMAADFVTGVLILSSINQSIVTYISLATLAAYTFVEQFKIYSFQYRYLSNNSYVCCICQKEIKHERKYTPNLFNLVFAALSCIFLIGMCCVEAFPFYSGELQKGFAYTIIIGGILVRLVFIKIKYYFFDMFGVIEFTYRPTYQ